MRAHVGEQLRALKQGRAGVLENAGAWENDDADARLWFAASLVQAEARAQACGTTGPLALTADAELTKLAAGFDLANQMRELLRGPLRTELVLVEVLLAWKAIGRPRAARTAGHGAVA